MRTAAGSGSMVMKNLAMAIAAAALTATKMALEARASLEAETAAAFIAEASASASAAAAASPAEVVVEVLQRAQAGMSPVAAVEMGSRAESLSCISIARGNGVCDNSVHHWVVGVMMNTAHG